MYEMIQAGSQSYYFDCPAKIGLYLRKDNCAYLIDSGNDKEAGRKVLKQIREKGWEVKGILITHAHADHIGGCQYLKKNTGCKIFAGGLEGAFTEHTILSPSFFYGGYPGKDLRHKFLLAAGSSVSGFNDVDFPKEVEIIPLPGHSFAQVGFGLPDGTVFMADCVSSEDTLKKYQIGVLYDVEAYLHTLHYAAEMEASVFIPSHTEPVADMRPLAKLNKEKVMEIIEKILNICKGPKNFEQILTELFTCYDLQMNMGQYVLVGNTLRSYLSWLKDSGKLGINISDNMLLYYTVG